MALTLEEQAQLARLKEIISTGAKETEFHSGGTRRRFEAQDLDQLRDEVARLEAKAQERPRRSLLQFSGKAFR